MANDLWQELDSLLEQDQPCVYCAIIATWGSTPQKPGAIMLVLSNGAQSGTLGGGCVEAEVKRKALLALATGVTQVETIFLDDLQGWDDGLICGGKMTFLIQPLIPGSALYAPARRFSRKISELALGSDGFVQAIVIDNSAGLIVGDRYLLTSDGNILDATAAPAAANLVSAAYSQANAKTRPTVSQGIAFLPTLPRIQLLIVGAGHVGQAVARLAAEVGFESWILDDRQQFANAERFPNATKITVGEIGLTLKEISQTLTSRCYALIVTRGHQHDQEALFHLANSGCGFIGMIGSKRKVRLILDELQSLGIHSDMLARVHAPLGLEIGSQTVPEIAISIVAQLIAHRNLGKSLP